MTMSPVCHFWYYHGRALELLDGSRLTGQPISNSGNNRTILIHPSFRLIAIAQADGKGGEASWLNPDVLNLFSWHVVPQMTPAEHRAAMARVFPSIPPGICDRLVAFTEELMKEEQELSSGNMGMAFSTRQLMRLCRRIQGMSEEVALKEVPDLVHETLLTRFASSQVQEMVDEALKRAGLYRPMEEEGEALHPVSRQLAVA